MFSSQPHFIKPVIPDLIGNPGAVMWNLDSRLRENDAVVNSIGEHAKHRFFFIGLLLLLLSAGTTQAQRSTFESTNIEAFGRFGWSVATAGDINGDGTPDVLVGAYAEDTEGLEDGGRAYLFSGANGSLVHPFVSPNSMEEGQFGWSVATAGDVDDDGIPDVLVGARGESLDGMPDSGRVYLFSGSDGSLIHTLISPYPAEGGHFGSSIASVDDLDNDGIADILIGAPEEDTDGVENGGRVYLFSGSGGSVIHTLVSPNAEQLGQFGGAVAPAGDIDGDGTPDVLVGAYAEDADGLSGSGRVYLFSGLDGTLIYALASPEAQADGFFGYSVAQPGDINGDGTPDVLVGAFGEAEAGIFRSGRAYLFSGSDGELMRILVSPHAEADGYFGARMSEAGDVNRDGIPDMLISAPFETADGFSFGGRAYVFSGVDGQAMHTLTSPHAEQLGQFGGAVSPAGDLDGDGIPDMLVGAPNEDAGGFFESGRTYVLSGQTGTVVPIEADPFLPPAYQLDAPFPNPFTAQTHLRLHLGRSQPVNVAVYDLMGRRRALLHDGVLVSGVHTLTLHGAKLPSGVYHIRMVAERFTASRRAVLVK